MIITIDGYSATGKSTIAEILAKRIGYTYINTGLLTDNCRYVRIKVY